MPTTKEDALALATSVRAAAQSLGKLFVDQHDTLTPTQRTAIESLAWDLQSLSSTLITKAVGLALEEAQGSADQLKRTVNKAQRAVKTLKDIRRVIGIGDKLLKVVGAILSGHPIAVVETSLDLAETLGA
jgi:hypothetical protein